MAKDHFLHPYSRTPKLLDYLHELEAKGKANGRTIAQEALAWILDQPGTTSVLVGASSVSQLDNNLAVLG
jgi:L-glyceraldehyde 3-phosphate reductase